MMKTLIRLILVLPAFLLGAAASAHGPFDSSSTLRVLADRIELELVVGVDAAREIQKHVGIGEQLANQVVQAQAQIDRGDSEAISATNLFRLSKGSESIIPNRLTVSSDGLEVLFTVDYPRPGAGEVRLEAAYFEAIDGLRQGVFLAQDGEGHQLAVALLSRSANVTTVFLPPARTTTVAEVEVLKTEGGVEDPAAGNKLTSSTPPTRPSFREFLVLGVEHILLGFDHLLFLGALLVGVRKIRTMVGIITCFTLAHSVTLALSALELVMISSRIVEPLIAVSIIVVAVENLVRKDAAGDRLWLAGGFGLIHGFGFASVLREIGLGADGASIAMPLFAFNLGVEIGQLAVAALVVPMLFGLRRFSGFARHGTPVLSVVVILVSGYWLLERTVLGG